MKIVIEGTRSEQMQQIKGYWTEDYDEKWEGIYAYLRKDEIEDGKS